MKAAGVAYKTWQTMRDGKVCARCLANQNAGPIPVDGTFPSGDKHPGAHPRCRCFLAPWALPKGATKVIRRQVDTNGQEFWGDAPQLEAHNPAGGGAATGPFPHRANGTYQQAQQDIPGGVPGASAGGEPPRWDGSEVEPHELSLESGDDGAWGEAAGIGSRPVKDFPAPYMDGTWPVGGHGTEQAGTWSPGAANGGPPNPVGKAAGAAAKFLKDAPPVKASVVCKMMRQNFPPSALKWVKSARWVGPVEVPLKLVDFSSEDAWAAHREPARVDAFARQLKAGEHVDEVILTVKPGHNHARCVDGHHRTMACKKACLPVRAYVAFLDEAGSQPADRTYLQQFHSGSDPANKAAQEPHVAGLMVRAADTGRVLMLQRSLDDDQDYAAGKWENPGGHQEPGETLLQAALREFSEETGMPAPQGTLTGSWDASNGIYRGYVMTVPSEGAVPIDGDRDEVWDPDDPHGDHVAGHRVVGPRPVPGQPIAAAGDAARS